MSSPEPVSQTDDLEMQLDQVARQIARAATVEEAVAILQNELAPVAKQIAALAAFSPETSTEQSQSAGVELWGECWNVDENTGTQIVDDRVLEVIESLSRVPMQQPALPAGLQHTYGYLLSIIPTPYGFKRDRWVQHRIDRGFGFTQPTLHAIPAQGTLLANLTYFLGRIAFRQTREELFRLEQSTKMVAKNVLAFNYYSLKTERLTETFSAINQHNELQQVSLHTDLVEFPFSDFSAAHTTLLIYSVEARGSGSTRLLTAFPITDENRRELTASEKLGTSQPISLKYNGLLSEILGNNWTGTRTLSPF